MNRLTLVVVAVLFAVFAFFLAAILVGFFTAKPDLAADELLGQLQVREGGQIRAILPGRKMLEIATPNGEALIGYWQQKEIGEQTLQPCFTVRWRPHEPILLPDFMLLEAKPLSGALRISGYKKDREKMMIHSQKFWLFVSPSLSVQLLNDLRFTLQAATRRLALASAPIAEISLDEKVLSFRYRTAIASVEQAQLMLKQSLAMAEGL